MNAEMNKSTHAAWMRQPEEDVGCDKRIIGPTTTRYILFTSYTFCLGFFCRARRPAPFSWRPALLKKPKWRPNFCLPFLLPTHSVDCAVHLLLSHSRALLVSSALFHPFTALIMPFSSIHRAKVPFWRSVHRAKVPFWRSVHRAKVPFWRSVHRAKVPFSDGTLSFWKPGQNTVYCSRTAWKQYNNLYYNSP